MKYVLILMLHFNWSVAATTAVFDDEAACQAAVKESSKPWDAIVRKAFCVPQGS